MKGPRKGKEQGKLNGKRRGKGKKAKGNGEAQGKGKGKDKGKDKGKVQCKGKAQVTSAPKLLLGQEKPREYSRIYHSTCDSAIKKGWATEQAKARAREVAKQHVASRSV